MMRSMVARARSALPDAGALAGRFTGALAAGFSDGFATGTLDGGLADGLAAGGSAGAFASAVRRAIRRWPIGARFVASGARDAAPDRDCAGAISSSSRKPSDVQIRVGFRVDSRSTSW